MGFAAIKVVGQADPLYFNSNNVVVVQDAGSYRNLVTVGRAYTTEMPLNDLLDALEEAEFQKPRREREVPPPGAFWTAGGKEYKWNGTEWVVTDRNANRPQTVNTYTWDWAPADRGRVAPVEQAVPAPNVRAANDGDYVATETRPDGGRVYFTVPLNEMRAGDAFVGLADEDARPGAADAERHAYQRVRDANEAAINRLQREAVVAGPRPDINDAQNPF